MTAVTNLTINIKQKMKKAGINTTSKLALISFDVKPFPVDSSLTTREANSVISRDTPNDIKSTPTEAWFKVATKAFNNNLASILFMYNKFIESLDVWFVNYYYGHFHVLF